MKRFFQNTGRLILNPNFQIGFYVILAILATLQMIAYGIKVYDSGAIYTRYNNFVIFSQSFNHLIEGKDLYISYPDESWDLFKYSPAFALFFGIFNLFPVSIGLSLWMVLNAIVLAIAIRKMPIKEDKKIGWMLLIVAIEALTSFQSQQSNALIAGLMVLSWINMEKDKVFIATGLLMASVFIKLFGIVGFILFLCYPNKLKAAAYSIFWFLFFMFIPLISTDFHTLIWQYENWGRMLANDHAISYGFSVMGWLYFWFGIEYGKNLILLPGAIILISPLIQWRKYNQRTFRILMLSSILVWVVIFNHKAESPTFVIAMTGAVIWYMLNPTDTFNKVLLIIAFIFTTLSPTDLFPTDLRKSFFVPYVIKVVPMIAIWLKINYDLWTNRGVMLKGLKV